MKPAVRRLLGYWLPPRSVPDNCRECGGAGWLPWFPPKRAPHELGCPVRQQELIEGMARSLHEAGSIIMTLEVMKELHDQQLFVNGEPTDATCRALRKLTHDPWAESAVAGMRWMSRLVDGKEPGPLPLFSTQPLPESPICEHGDCEQRWCNRSRSDGRICADVQMAIDLRRKP